MLFLHHVATLPNDTLAREIYEVQNKLELPGLLSECKEFLVVNGVTDLSKYSKLQWKSMVDRIIKLMNKDDILNMMKKPYKKISYQDHVNEKFQVQPYLKTMNISEARMRFKLKTGMTPTVQMNFPSSAKFVNNLWTCVGCTPASTDTDRQLVGRSLILWSVLGTQSTGRTWTWKLTRIWSNILAELSRKGWRMKKKSVDT